MAPTQLYMRVEKYGKSHRVAIMGPQSGTRNPVRRTPTRFSIISDTRLFRWPGDDSSSSNVREIGSIWNKWIRSH